MAGITDLPLRKAARSWGAALTYSEMLTSQTTLWQSDKSRTRLPQMEDPLPRPIQIAGYDPQMLADAAVACEQMGAGLIDINMGCPAKKVCKRAAGSALMKDEGLVEDILKAVTKAVSVPVTLKTRTGTSPEEKNGLRIAEIAEQSGVQAISIHGRTRACRFAGQAEYDSIAEISQHLSIPVIANGDINTPAQAKQVLEYTGAAAVMIGRGALGKPWIFQQIRDYLALGTTSTAPDLDSKFETLSKHLSGIHQLYAEVQGVRIARKHMGWYFDALVLDELNDDIDHQESDNNPTSKSVETSKAFKSLFNQLQSGQEQQEFLTLMKATLLSGTNTENTKDLLAEMSNRGQLAA